MSTTETRAVTGEFAWHDLITTDVEAAKRFYSALLGWEFTSYQTGDFEYPMIHVGERDHGGMVALDVTPGLKPHWIGHVRVPDLDEAMQRARKEGGSVAGEPGELEGVGRWARVVDPHGGSISAFEPAYDTPASQAVFAWEELHSPDPEAAARFYGAVLGWGNSEMDMDELGTYVLLERADGQSVAGIFPRPPDRPGPATWLPYIAAEDVDAASARAAELGATPHVQPATVSGVGRFSTFADPAGAPFGLFSPEG
jgi:predicted enzyme related to lactoylglutathione lyase